MKEITKDQVNLLVKRNVIRNSNKGYLDKHGEPVGFYRTRNKRYIEDQYADMVKRIS